MGLTINTNLASLIVQNSLSDSTKNLNAAIERMTTGYKINSARDDAAGYAVATKMSTQLSSIQVCQNNVAMGQSLLDTVSNSTDLIVTHLQRMRDLVEQAQNGTYGDDSIAAMQAEYTSRYDESYRICASAEYNGIKPIFPNSPGVGNIGIQVGIDSSANSKISMHMGDYEQLLGPIYYICFNNILDPNALNDIDSALNLATTYQTDYGAYMNRLDSAAEALDIQYQNVTSSLSTIKDADLAKESSSYIKNQILQQASATLLSTANQTPSIALNLI